MQNIKIIMDNIICGIYKITSPSGKIYIGQSINIKSRWKYYEKLRCNKQFKIMPNRLFKLDYIQTFLISAFSILIFLAVSM